MTQLFAQMASRPDSWVRGFTSAAMGTVMVVAPLVVTYYGGGSDTIPAGTVATVYGTAGTTFDSSHDVYVVFTIKGSGTLQVVKEGDLATVTGDWAGLARLMQHAVEPYQPQAYLAAGGLGTPPTTTTVLLSTAGAHRVYDLGYNGAYATPPAGWQTLGFTDSGWALSQLQTGEGPYYTAPAGAAFETANPTPSGYKNRFLLRASFVLGAGVPTGAALSIVADDEALAAYLNGTAVVLSGTHGPTGPPYDPVQTALPAGLLVPGGTNVLALEIGDVNLGGFSPAAVAFALSVQYGAVAGVADPGGHEGDLLYYHNGAWSDLPIGTTGQELTVVSGDPAWATPTASGVTSIDVAVPAPLASSGGPITASGTITLSWASGQTANRVLASPNGSSGAVGLRALVVADIPALPASQITTGQLAPARGGTGIDSSAVTDGQVVIGQSSDHTLGLATLTAGSGVTITNGGHSVTIGATGSGGTVTSVALSAPALFSVAGSPVSGSGTLALTYAAGQKLPTAQGGTGTDGSSAANGTLLIGNGSGYTLATLTAGSNISITNSAGGISIAASGGGGGSLTTASANLGGDVTLVANTWTDSVTVSLAAGTWLLWGGLDVYNSTGSAATIVGRIYDGTTVYASHETTINAGWANSIEITSEPIVLSGTTTLKLQVNAQNAFTVKASTVLQTQAKSTYLRGLKVA